MLICKQILGFYILISFVDLINICPVAFAFTSKLSTGVCDHYVLLHNNMTYDGISNSMEKDGVPTIMAHTFQAKSLVNSQCVDIISCAPPDSKAHKDLMNAVRKQKSLSWQVLPCKEPEMHKQPDQEKDIGNFILTSILYNLAYKIM